MKQNKKDNNIAKKETCEECLETVEEQTESILDDTVEIVDEITKKIQQLEEQNSDYLDKYQRGLAEFDNFRKRTIKEKASMYDDGVKDTVSKLLVVVDNLERAIDVSKTNVEISGAFLSGVQMTLKQFQETLNSLGVMPIEAIGEKFDPNLHSAVAHEDNADFGENEVVAELLKGYLYKEKVLRHSMVKVAN